MKRNRHILILVLVMCLVPVLKATHNRAGEITYKRIAPFTKVISGNTVNVYNYRIRVALYTNDGQDVVDHCRVTIYFGDGDSALAYRKNGLAGGCSNNDCSPIVPCGEVILNTGSYVVKKNIFEYDHTYPGAGTFTVRVTDNARNEGIVNILNSVNQPFYVEALLLINSFTGPNSSPDFYYDPIDRACIGQCFQHNVGAFDADKDSLSYEISTSRGANSKTLPGYSFPNFMGGTYTMDQKSGLLQWCTPVQQGEYNLALIVKEWRKGTNGQRYLIGYVFRDMQVIVTNCPNQHPPLVALPADTCVEAGALIMSDIFYSDPDTGDTLRIVGNSGAFALPGQATLSGTLGVAQAAQNLSAKFKWQTRCEDISSIPYNTVFKVTDNGKPPQSRYASWFIKVIPPAIKNITAQPIGTAIKISWQAAACNATSNPLLQYKIYRKNTCTPFTPKPCETGVSSGSGFTLIDSVSATTTQYTDNDNGNGLVVGQNYSYLVIGIYGDGSQTRAVSTVCAQLKRDVPVLLNVDVLSTSTMGAIKIAWAAPLTDGDNLDTLKHPGPYQYNLVTIQPDGNRKVVFTETKNSVLFLSSGFTHTNVSTVDTNITYQLDFIAGGELIGSSQKATSVFVMARSSDRRVDLNWSSKTPWSNYNYTIRRKNPDSQVYQTIGVSATTTFTDTALVVNNHTYCYLVTSEGKYSNNNFPFPLLNNSQKICVRPEDHTPPCEPQISLEADCPKQQVLVSWNGVKKTCRQSDDVVSYNVFFKPFVSAEYILVAEIPADSVLAYSPGTIDLISGCYYVQAVDSAGNKSTFAHDVCLDNCPIYELPNIFTPNNDGVNDHFKAIRVRQISEIDLYVYDRWGNQVYHTADPYFKWNGVSSTTNERVSEGVFFYICDVFEPHVRGVVKRSIKGSVQVTR